MKLRRFLSVLLAVVVVVTAIPTNIVLSAEDSSETKTINAIDETYVLRNNMKNSDNLLGISGFGDIRGNHPSLYDDPYGLYTKNDASKDSNLSVEESTYRWPYAAIKVSVEQTGTYDLSLVVNSNKSAKYNTFGMMVDGIMHVLSYDKSSSKATVSTKVSLSAGTHVIVFTTAMPADPVVAKDLEGDSRAYPWFNFHSFTLGTGLKVENAPTKQEVIDSACTRVEAENTAYVSYVGYESAKTETPTGASGKTVGGVSRNSELKQTYAQLSEYLDKVGMAYVQYAVEAPADGIYNIRVGYLAGGSGDKPFVSVLVNDTAYKAQFDNAWGSLDSPTLAVEMKKGINIIRCTSLTTDQACFSKSWINQDYLDVDSQLTVLDATSLNTVNAGDETKVLANQYTDKGNTLESAVTSAIRGDLPSIETLHLTGNKLVKWPWAAIKVTAAKDGYYDITANIGPNSNSTSKQIAMLVDGEVVSQKFTVASSAGVDASVFLKAGTHTLVFTIPMPKTAAEASALTSATVGAAYPWCNYNSFAIDSRLTVGNAPTLTEVKKDIGLCVNAGDETKVLAKNFTDNGNTLGSAVTDDFKWDRASIENILSYDLSRATYAALKVTVEEDGTYDVYTTISTKAATTSKQIALIIDYERVEVISIEGKSGNQFVGKGVELTAGTHILLFTCAMPATQEEANAVPAGSTDNWVSMNNAYPWFDFISFTFGKGVIVESIAESNTDGIEAENTEYVSYAGGYKDYIYPGASSGKVAGGSDVINSSSTFGKDKTYYNWGSLSYVEFAVDVAAAGKQKVTLSVNATCTPELESDATPTVLIYVNGELYEAKLKNGWNQFEEVALNVNLAKGTNVIKCLGVADEVKEGTRLLFDYFEFDDESIAAVTAEDVNALSTLVKAGDETKVLANNYTDKGDTLEGASTTALRRDKLTLDVLSLDDLKDIPYAALKVTAETDGYYDITAILGINKSAGSDQIGLFVDGTTLYILGFQTTSTTEATGTIYLTKGTHTLVFTSPMPETVAEFEAYIEAYNADKTETSKLTTGDGSTHPWMNFISFVLSEGLSVEAIPTVAEVEYPSYNRIEAEDNKYVIYNGYKPEGEKSSKASGGKVAGGVNRWVIERTFEDLKTWIDASDSHVAYVEYAIYAPTDGQYNIRVGYLAEVNKTVKNRNEIDKPFVAVLVNDDIYKAQYTEDWGESEAVAVNVNLKKGQNIIRVTTYTAEQEIRTVSSWINQDYIDLDKRLTALERTTTVVEAEDSQYYHLLTPQNGGEKEKASNGKVLGRVQNIRAKSIGLTIENFTADRMRMVPYFSYTVDAPIDGYYSISLNFCSDGRMPKSQIGVIVDDEISAVKYNRCGASSGKNKAIITVYLTKGEHNITFTSPLPMNDEEFANANWSYYWMNFDYVTFHDGLKLAAKQKSPTTIPDLVRIEAEDVGLPNLTKVNVAAEGKDAKEGYVGGARYRRSQSVAEIKKDGIDARKTPFVQYTVNAKTTGTYTVYFSASYGIYQSPVAEKDATFAIEVNGEVSFYTVKCVKDKTNTSLIPVTMKLSAGNNIVRLTHLTSDSIVGEGYCWADFNYIEMAEADAEKIIFMPTTGVVEAERSDVVSCIVNSSANSSGGECVGNANYSYMDEHDITFENLDVKNLDEIPRVTYTVVAEKAGTYNLAIQFKGGVKNYTYAQLIEMGAIGFAVSVNEGEKQLVEYCPDAGSSFTNRIVEVDLKEGENKIMVTVTLADYMTGVSPRIEDEYRLYWIDHDAIRLTAGVTATDMNVEPYDVNDTDIDHAQLSAKEPTILDIDGDGDGINMVAVGIIAASTLALVGLFIFIIISKKHKKDEE